MKASLRAKLDIIDDMLMSEDGRDLYDILGVVRGPDNEQMALKWPTTAKVRAVAFPRWAKPKYEGVNFNTFYADVNWTPLSEADEPKEIGHFQNHARAAIRSLLRADK